MSNERMLSSTLQEWFDSINWFKWFSYFLILIPGFPFLIPGFIKYYFYPAKNPLILEELPSDSTYGQRLKYHTAHALLTMMQIEAPKDFGGPSAANNQLIYK